MSRPTPAAADLRTEAHVWLASTGDPAVAARLEAYRELLTPDEAERHERIRPPESRREFLLGRALVRTTLSRYAEVAPGDWRFRTVGRGRPEIAAPEDAPPLRFNLSHSRGLAGCVVARELDVGLDVEHVERPLDLDRFARRFYSPRERALLATVAGDARKQLFFAIWTLKEAYLKARGIGVALPLASLTFEPRGDGELDVDLGAESDDSADAWRFAVWKAPAGFVVGLAMRRSSGAGPRPVTRGAVPLGPEAPAVELELLAGAGVEPAGG